MKPDYNPDLHLTQQRDKNWGFHCVVAHLLNANLTPGQKSRRMKQKANVIAMHRNSGRGKKTCIYTLQELLSLSDRLTATNIRLGQSVFSDSGPTPGVTPTHVPISSPALGPRGKLKARLSSKVNITTTSLPTSPEPCSSCRVEVRGGVGWRTCY